MKELLLDLIEVGFLVGFLIVLIGSGPRYGMWKRWRRRNWTEDDWAKVSGRELFPEIFGGD
jgi:hypothetical protein